MKNVSVGVNKNDNSNQDYKMLIKQKFIEQRGYWSDGIWNNILELDPYFLEKYLEFSSVPFKNNYISLKDKELIYIAFDVSATHLYEPGTEAHMKNALEYGASSEEILEVIEIASLLGMQTFHHGAPILIEELEKKGEYISDDLNKEQQKLKKEFIEKHGYWNEVWEAPLKISPEIFSAYLGLSMAPLKHGYLNPKMRQFIYLAVDAAGTHLNSQGIRIHVHRALELGATKEEITEVFELVSTLGIHAATVSVPILKKVINDNV